MMAKGWSLSQFLGQNIKRMNTAQRGGATELIDRSDP